MKPKREGAPLMEAPLKESALPTQKEAEEVSTSEKSIEVSAEQKESKGEKFTMREESALERFKGKAGDAAKILMLATAFSMGAAGEARADSGRSAAKIEQAADDESERTKDLRKLVETKREKEARESRERVEQPGVWAYQILDAFERDVDKISNQAEADLVMKHYANELQKEIRFSERTYRKAERKDADVNLETQLTEYRAIWDVAYKMQKQAEYAGRDRGVTTFNPFNMSNDAWGSREAKRAARTFDRIREKAKKKVKALEKMQPGFGKSLRTLKENMGRMGEGGKAGSKGNVKKDKFELKGSE